MSKKKEDEPVVVESSNLPVSIEDEIRKQLAAQKEQIGALPSNTITLKGKNFTLPNGQSTPDPIEVIIVDFAWFLVHYPGVYNANNPQRPDCFAVGREQPNSGKLVADESVPTPYGTTCAEKDCPMNQWNSSPTGAGKACKNQRRLVLVPPDFNAESEPMTMYVSPMGLKNFDAYVSRLAAEHGVLPIQVVTEISFDPHQTYPLLKFKFVDRHPNVEAAWSLRARCEELLFRGVELGDDKKKKAS